MTHSDYLYSRIAELLANPTDECEIWPYGQNGRGYGRLRSGVGGERGTHSAACVARNGPRPPGLEAAHACGNRLCFNPHHLSWKTHKANAADRTLHGTILCGESHPSAKLSAADVAEIRSSTRSQRELAEMYGVHHPAIGKIRRRERWAHIAGP